jgi:hypothetical protein
MKIRTQWAIGVHQISQKCFINLGFWFSQVGSPFLGFCLNCSIRVKYVSFNNLLLAIHLNRVFIRYFPGDPILQRVNPLLAPGADERLWAFSASCARECALCVWSRRSSEGFYCRWWKIHRKEDDLGVRDYSLSDSDDDFLNSVFKKKVY